MSNMKEVELVQFNLTSKPMNTIPNELCFKQIGHNKVGFQLKCRKF